MSNSNIAKCRWSDRTSKADIVVFDLDGTLIETDLANFLSYEAAINHIIGHCPPVQLDSTKRITRKILKEMLPTAQRTLIEDIVEHKERIYGQFLHTTSVNQSLLWLLELAQGKDVILATDCRRARAELVLSYHGLWEKFTRKYFCDNDNPNSKYERIFADLDINSRQVVVFENDPLLVTAAIEAGADANSVFLVCNS